MKIKLIISICVATLLSLSHCYAASNSNSSSTQSEEVNSFNALSKLAEKGDANAQNKIAINYTQGITVTRDLNKAFYWFEKAANQNHPEAQYNYATFLINGYATAKSPEKSIPWFKKSALQGYVNAQNSLGIIYMTGLGTKIDYFESFKWNHKAAEGGVADAMYNLGQLYEKGAGTDQNSAKAIYWYEQAAKQGFTLAEFELGVAHAEGLGGYEKSIPKAIEWYEKAANKGNMFAQSNLANLHGLGCDNIDYLVGRNDKGSQPTRANTYSQGCNARLALFWYQKAADQGLPYAQFKLGQIYVKTGDIGKITGLEWIAKSAQNGYFPAKEFIAKHQEHLLKTNNELKDQFKKESETWPYKSSAALIQAINDHNAMAIEHQAIANQFGLLGFERNLSTASDNYIKHLSLNSVPHLSHAQKNLESLYDKGLQQNALGLSDEYAGTKSNIEQTANKGDLTAIKFLARFYNSGSCGYFSIKQAKAWYEKAANLEDKGAMLALARLYRSTNPNEPSEYDQADYEKSLFWFKQLDLNNKPNAQYELANLYLNDKTSEKNPEQAISLLHKAANSQHIEAKAYLAKLYKDGKLISKDNEKAIVLYKELATISYPAGRDKQLFNSVATSLAEIYSDTNNPTRKPVDAYVWYTLAKEVSQRKEPPLQKVANPHALSPGVKAGASRQCGNYSDEFDDYPESLRLTGGTTENKKHLFEKLAELEKTLSSDEVKSAKIALQEWREKWPLQK